MQTSLPNPRRVASRFLREASRSQGVLADVEQITRLFEVIEAGGPNRELYTRVLEAKLDAVASSFSLIQTYAERAERQVDSTAREMGGDLASRQLRELEATAADLRRLLLGA